MKDVSYHELIGKPGNSDKYPWKTLEKIECYGDSIQEAITELNNELIRKGHPELIRRNNGTYSCGLIEIAIQGLFKRRIEQRTNIVLHATRNDKHIVAVFLPRLQFYKLKDRN